MKAHNSKIEEYLLFIDTFAYVILVFLLVLYSIFASNFSEIHIQLPLINLPVFVGEIVLGILLILAVLKYYIVSGAGRLDSRTSLWILLIMGFILLKAFFGYRHWQALALRNAAMFYYFFYAVLTFFFYNFEVFQNTTVKILGISVLFLVPILRLSHEYYLFSYLCLILFLAAQASSLRMKVLIVIFLIIFFPFHQLFETSRGALVGIFSGAAFIILFLSYLFWKKNWISVLFSTALFLLIVFVGYVYMGDVTKSRFQSTLDFKGWIKHYHYMLAKADESLLTYKPHEFELRLYQVNATAKLNTQDEFDQFIKKTKTILPVVTPSKISLIELNRELNEDVAQFKLSKEARDGRGNSFQDRSLDEFYSNSGFRNERLMSVGNLVWRFILWRDLLDDFQKMLKKPTVLLFGFDFGRPIRSKRLEASGRAYPVQTGWLEPHNSVLHILYRGGLIGFLFLLVALRAFWKKTMVMLETKSLGGVLLLSIVIYWFVFSLSLVVLELPHYAIPFWCLTGLAFAYLFKESGFSRVSIKPPKKTYPLA